MSRTISKAYPFLGNFVITSLYGYREAFATSQGTSGNDHRGLDMAARGNTNIVSCVSGIVIDVGYTKARGNYVLVKGYDGFTCTYQHLASISVTKGMQVSCKQKLGVQGATGNVSGAHLHLEVGVGNTVNEVYNSTINPADYLGMQNTSTLVGKTFSGNGFITGDAADMISTNNSNSAVTPTYGTVSSETTTTTGGYADILLPSGEYYEVREDSAVEGDWLYGRRYRIFVDISGNKAFDISELRCTFEIVKSGYAEANQSIIQIYNMNPNDENKIIKQGQRIVVEAGYAGSQYGKIFDGQIIQAIRSKENSVDYVLTLVAMDNDRYTAYGLINTSISANQTARDAVNALANSAAVPTEVGTITQMDITYPRGKVLFGMSKEYLAQIAKSANASYYSEDGKINIISLEQEAENRIKSYGPRNGLLGVPSQNELGITCEVLLDPSVNINTFFHVDNDKIAGYQYQVGQPLRGLDNEGIYRVIRLTHVGDTRGEDWYTSIEAVSQAGIIPSMLSSGTFYGW